MSNAARRDAPPGNYAANHADGTLGTPRRAAPWGWNEDDDAAGGAAARSEHVQVVADHHPSSIELTNLLQQHLLWIWTAYSAGVGTVIQNQQSWARLLRDLRHFTR